MIDKNNLAPIVLFVYNRLDHTKQTINMLKKNVLANDSQLYIYSDGPKNYKDEVSIISLRDYLKTIEGFKHVTIIERNKNYGLAKNIIEGVSDIINEYGKVIVLEDDLITSKYFLDYMNKCLNLYQDNKTIYSITGFNFSTSFMTYPSKYNEDVFLNIRPMSWSWGTWKDRWESVDWTVNDYKQFMNDATQQKAFNKGGTDLVRMLKNQMNGKINSWYIRWTYNAYKQKKFTIYPKIAYVNNIGHDSTGTHCVDENNDIYSHTELNTKMITNLKKNIKFQQEIVNNFNRGFNTNYLRIIKRKLTKLQKKLRTIYE